MSNRLSIVIPTFNRCESLRRTLDGLTRQTHPLEDVEVVVVSDGSTDGTDALLQEYAARVPYRLRPIAQANAGPSAARNNGVRQARHEVVVFLDDDVDPIPTWLAHHAAHHAADDRVAVIGPMSPDPDARAHEPVWIAWEHAKLQETYALFQPGGAYVGTPVKPVHFYSGNASVRRCWLEAAGGFDESYTRQEDVELAVRLEARCGVRFVYDFDAVGLHRPVRSFDSWLRVPTSYGAFDACRVRDGGLDPREVQRLAASRNAATRALTRLCENAPALLPPVTSFARALAVFLHRRGRSGAAVAVLSGLYNASYAAAYRQGLSARQAAPRAFAEAK